MRKRGFVAIVLVIVWCSVAFLFFEVPYPESSWWDIPAKIVKIQTAASLAVRQFDGIRGQRTFQPRARVIIEFCGRRYSTEEDHPERYVCRTNGDCCNFGWQDNRPCLWCSVYKIARYGYAVVWLWYTNGEEIHMADQAIINELTAAENATAWVATSMSWKARMEQRRALRQLYPAETGYMYANYAAVLARAITNTTSGVEV
jgi:4-amino-4-deoxy-L-arabinose transferase-like glycosyltransferase